MSSWDLLATELQQWQSLNQVPTLWWRDDDAQQQSVDLETLNQLSLDYNVPLHLAVIPEHAENSLLPFFAKNPQLYALQHGYGHHNHAPKTQRKCELGDDRPLTAILEELLIGKNKLHTLLDKVFNPTLVPPWNRLSEALPTELNNLGFVGLSTLGPRTQQTISGLQQVNVHVDIINWKQRTFAGDEAVLAQLINHLSQRRLNQVDAEEATGIMTHHLAHDAACWDFCERLFIFLQQHAVHWLTANELFPSSKG